MKGLATSRRGIAPATLHVLAAKDRPLLALPATPAERLSDVAARLHGLGRHADAVAIEAVALFRPALYDRPGIHQPQPRLRVNLANARDGGVGLRGGSGHRVSQDRRRGEGQLVVVTACQHPTQPLLDKFRGNSA